MPAEKRVKVPILDLKAQLAEIGPEFEAVVIAAVRSMAYIMGPQVGELEKACAAYVGSKHAMGVSSGTDALLVALMAPDAGHGGTAMPAARPPTNYFVAAGAVVARDVPDNAMVDGVPARRVGWVCECRERVAPPEPTPACEQCKRVYRLREDILRPE